MVTETHVCQLQGAQGRRAGQKGSGKRMVRITRHGAHRGAERVRRDQARGWSGSPATGRTGAHSGSEGIRTSGWSGSPGDRHHGAHRARDQPVKFNRARGEPKRDEISTATPGVLSGFIKYSTPTTPTPEKHGRVRVTDGDDHDHPRTGIAGGLRVQREDGVGLHT